MALTRILGLANSPTLHNCRRTFFTALIHRDSKACSKRFFGPVLRNFCASPVVSNDMKKSETDDLIHSVKSLRTDFDLLRRQFGLLCDEVRRIQNCDTRGSFVTDYSGSEEIWDDENVTEKMISQDNNAAENTSDLPEEILISQDKAVENTSGLSEEILISQDNKAAEKMSYVSEEIQNTDTEDNNEMLAAEKMNDFSEEKSDTDQGNNEKVTEAMATDDTELQKSDAEDQGNNEKVPDSKEQDRLLIEIESEISRAVNFDRVSSQCRYFPDDFPFVVYIDNHGVPSVTFYGGEKSDNIYVTVSRPTVITSITAENYHYHNSSSFIMQVQVEIFEDNTERRGIAFDCSAFSTGFLIDNVYVPENVYGTDHRDTRGRLEFRELNDNLKKEFKKYLETRGITNRTTNIIFGYMLDKANREKLRSLYKFQKVVEA